MKTFNVKCMFFVIALLCQWHTAVFAGTGPSSVVDEFPYPEVYPLSSMQAEAWKKSGVRLFYLSFDGNAGAQTAAGMLNPAGEKGIDYVEGRFGQAVRFTAGSSLTYNLKDMVLPVMGSISFHIKPVDWSVTDTAGFSLFSLYAADRPKEGIFFYRREGRADNRPDTLNGPWTMEFKTPGLNIPVSFTAAEWTTVSRGRYGRAQRENVAWHHALLTWDMYADRILLFLDGELWGEYRNIRVPDVLDNLTIGIQAGSDREFLLDDFAIYKYPLCRETAKLIAQGQSPGWEPEARQERQPELLVEYDRLGQAYYYRLFLGDNTIPPDGIEVRVIDVTGKTFASTFIKDTPLLGWVFGKQCVQDVPVGKYHVLTQIGPFYVRKRMDKDTAETWDDAGKLGTDDILLPPFTPVEISGDNLTCYGRDYKLGKDSVLIEQITSKNKLLLKKPLTINVLTGGRQATLKDRSRMAVTGRKDTAVTVERIISVTEGAADKSVIRLKQTLEQDGLLVFEMELHPHSGQPVELEQIFIEMEMPAEDSTLLSYRRTSRVSEERRAYAGYTFTEEENMRSTGFVPMFTVAGDEAGLSWLCDNPDYWGWNNANAEEVFVWKKTADGTKIIINLINKPSLKIKDILHYRFAFMALPVRPLRADARKWRLCIISDNPALGGTGWEGILPHSNLGDFRNWTWCIGDSLIPDDMEMVRQSVAASKQAGVTAAPHWAYTYQGALLPESSMYREIWKKHGGSQWYMSLKGSTGASLRQDIMGITREKFYGSAAGMPVAQLGHMNYHASANSKMLRDYVTWQQYRLVRDAGVKAFMYDVPDIYQDRLPPVHGIEELGFSDKDGRLSMQWPFFAHRELMRRTRTAFVNLGVEPLMVAHYGVMNPPAYSYCDLVMNGENLMFLTGWGSGRETKQSYFEAIGDMSFVRADMAQNRWGFSTQCMPRGDIQNSRQALAITLLHDMTLGIGDGVAREDVGTVWNAYDTFGLSGNDRFIGYYHPKPPVADDNIGILASAYVKEDRALLVMVNTGNRDFQGSLKVDFAGMGLKVSDDRQVRDLYKNADVTLKGNELSLALEKNGGLAIVEIRQGEAVK